MERVGVERIEVVVEEIVEDGEGAEYGDDDEIVRTIVGIGVETIVTGFGVGVGVAVVNFPPDDAVGVEPKPEAVTRTALEIIIPVTRARNANATSALLYIIFNPP